MTVKKYILVSLLMIVSGSVVAGSAENVLIAKIATGPLYSTYCGSACVPIAVSPQPVSFASCSQNTGSWHYALETSTEAGKQAYSHLMAAYISGKEISVYGKGTCVGSSGYEEVNYLISE